ncbi:MAG: hypothetical protein IJ607_03690 [Bacteroidaceae bacterium]|nr:hypothetical protein [Bacteroidaceae bacterium]
MKNWPCGQYPLNTGDVGGDEGGGCQSGGCGGSADGNAIDTRHQERWWG